MDYSNKLSGISSATNFWKAIPHVNTIASIICATMDSSQYTWVNNLLTQVAPKSLKTAFFNGLFKMDPWNPKKLEVVLDVNPSYFLGKMPH
jgi:hypothetical protein